MIGRLTLVLALTGGLLVACGHDDACAASAPRPPAVRAPRVYRPPRPYRPPAVRAPRPYRPPAHRYHPHKDSYLDHHHYEPPGTYPYFHADDDDDCEDD